MSQDHQSRVAPQSSSRPSLAPSGRQDGEPAAEVGLAAPAAAPLPPPPPPLPSGEDIRTLRFRHDNPRWKVPGGYIVHNVQRDSLDAHCERACHYVPTNPCRVNRTYCGDYLGRPTARGRPLGFLLAWLEVGCDPDCKSRDAHSRVADARRRTPDDEALMSKERRLAARQKALDTGRYTAMFDLERPCRDGEGLEPDGLA